MYRKFYRFKEDPFSITADPSFFYYSSAHADAFASLLYGVTQRKGIMTITGEVGTGKTTVCRALMHSLNKNTHTAFVLNPNLSDIELLRYIMADLGLGSHFKDKLSIISTLNEYLLKESCCGNNVAIIIDEAQHLSINQLELIRLLSNLETEKNKLLQIILSAQPELDDKLQLNELRQLNQRIAVKCQIKPLSLEDMVKYINHRIKCVTKRQMFSRHLEFSAAAIKEIFYHTGGIPRLINILCDRALLAGYSAESFVINEKMIERSAAEVLNQ